MTSHCPVSPTSLVPLPQASWPGSPSLSSLSVLCASGCAQSSHLFSPYSLLQKTSSSHTALNTIQFWEIHISKCLLDLSTQISNWHFISQTEFSIFLPQTCFSCSLCHLSKWYYHSYSCSDQRLQSYPWFLSFSYNVHLIHQ